MLNTLGHLLFRSIGRFFRQLWILIANIIAAPVAYYIMTKWLQEFAYRISIDFRFFLVSGGIVIIIALFTVGYQAIKAAYANPVDTIRYE